MQDSPPDFSTNVNRNAFDVPGATDLNNRLNSAGQGVDSVNYDWGSVKDLLGRLASGQAFADDRAAGKGLTAGAQTRYGQDNLAESKGGSANLGMTLMKLGSKGSAQQATQVAAAQHQQQMAAIQQATSLHQQDAAQRIDMYKKELDLQNQKFEMNRSIVQAQNGLDLARLQLKNMYNRTMAGARNAQELGDLRVQADNFNQIMGYIGTGLGAASAVTAAGAQAYGAASAQDKADTALAGQYDSGSALMSARAAQGIGRNFAPAFGDAYRSDAAEAANDFQSAGDSYQNNGQDYLTESNMAFWNSPRQRR